MRSFLAAAVLGASSMLATAAPVSSAQNPNPGNGWPNPSASQVNTIQQQALGTLPNGSVPTTLSSEGVTNFQLIALNELFEVEFFTSLLNNVTQGVKGFEVPKGTSKQFVVKTLQTIVAQEELHALNANGALKHFGHDAILPCTDYVFPTETFMDAIKLAGTFTSVVLGTLQDVIRQFAMNGDTALPSAVSAVIGNEAEQEAYFRMTQGQIPNELPFLTGSVRDFAFTALQGFAAPGSCPSVASINLKTFKPLTVVDTPTHKTETIKYSFASSGYTTGTGLWATYLNQQNVPVTVPTTLVSNKGGVVTVSATFPYEEHMLNGLTIASLTDCEGPFATSDDVVPAAVYGPGLIIVQAPGTTSEDTGISG